MIKNYLIVAKNDEKSYRIARELKTKLEGVLCYDEKNADLIISIGGDGTMLHAVHLHMDKIDHAYFIGVHTGTLGFYTDYQCNEIDELVTDIKKGEYTSYDRSILDIELIGKHSSKHYHALNEMRLENPHYTQVLNVYINDELLETFRGNGICVSTPSGSTAYNKSIGGAVVHPDLKVMQLTEIAGIHHNAYRSLGSSIILAKNEKVTLKSDHVNGAFIGVDQFSYDLDNEDFEELVVSLSKHTVKCIQYRPLSFVKRIRRSFISE